MKSAKTKVFFVEQPGRCLKNSNECCICSNRPEKLPRERGGMWNKCTWMRFYVSGLGEKTF